MGIWAHWTIISFVWILGTLLEDMSIEYVTSMNALNNYSNLSENRRRILSSGEFSERRVLYIVAQLDGSPVVNIGRVARLLILYTSLHCTLPVTLRMTGAEDHSSICWAHCVHVASFLHCTACRVPKFASTINKPRIPFCKRITSIVRTIRET